METIFFIKTIKDYRKRNGGIDMNKRIQEERRTILAHWGFEPDKRVSDMTLGELYNLMKLAIKRKDEAT